MDHPSVSGSADLTEGDEPRLHYVRVLNDVPRIFTQDSGTCLAVRSRLMVIGSSRGRVYVLDPSGNQLRHYALPSAPAICYSAHSTSVNRVCIDSTSEHVASCANDGKLCVFGLVDEKNSVVIPMSRPVRVVEFSPDFAKTNSGQILFTGDRELTMHQKRLFGGYKHQPIYAGRDRDGTIHAISCMGEYVAFANETGVRIYDTGLRQIITKVQRTHDLALRSTLYPASLCWLSGDTLSIGWADTLTICAIRHGVNAIDSGAGTNGASGGVGKLVEVRHCWELGGHYCCGVAKVCDVENPDSWRELLLLTVCKRASNGSVDECGDDALISDQNDLKGSDMSDLEQNEQQSDEELEDPVTGASLSNPHQPRIWLIEPVNFANFELIADDTVAMRDAAKLQPHNYHLGSVPRENLHYVMNNRDMLEIRPSSCDDRLQWLLDNELFARAVQFVQNHSSELTVHSGSTVAKMYMDWLIARGAWAQAAALCAQVCGRQKHLWEEYATLFDRAGKMSLLAPHLPTGDPRLEPECYESALAEFVRADPKQFGRLVARKNMDATTHDSLLLTVAQLYTYERNYERALGIYMNLRDKAVFPLIDRYRLFPQVKERIRELMDIDTELAVRLLLENEDSLPPETVLRQLGRQPKLQLAYLEKLFARNEGAKFADLAVSLYAKHSPSKLLPFLRRDQHYNIEKALATCQQLNLVPEVVFLLGRGGNRREALRVIVNEQKDVMGAIEFCREHDDCELWRDLITLGVHRPAFVTTLMQNIGTYIDPAVLIRLIPADMKIPELRTSLVKILDDYQQRLRLQEGCARVTRADTDTVLSSLRRLQVRAKPVREACARCNRSLLAPPSSAQASDASASGDVFVFGCEHAFHRMCVIGHDEGAKNALCIICAERKVVW